MGSPWQRLRRLLAAVGRGRPVIVISGLPRSGTSMAMAMLRAGGVEVVQDEVRRADDDNPRGYFEDERVKDLGQSDAAWVRSARGRAVKVISHLLQHLPRSNRYRVILMRRNIGEVLASQQRMLANRGEEPAAEDARVAEAYEQHLWQIGFRLRRDPLFELLELEYAAVVADPRPAAERIAAFLRLPLDVDAMVAAVDARLYRNRAS